MSKTKVELIEENNELKRSVAIRVDSYQMEISVLEELNESLQEELETVSNHLTVAEEYIRDLLSRNGK